MQASDVIVSLSYNFFKICVQQTKSYNPCILMQNAELSIHLLHSLIGKSMDLNAEFKHTSTDP